VRQRAAQTGNGQRQRVDACVNPHRQVGYINRNGGMEKGNNQYHKQTVMEETSKLQQRRCNGNRQSIHVRRTGKGNGKGV